MSSVRRAGCVYWTSGACSRSVSARSLLFTLRGAELRGGRLAYFSSDTAAVMWGYRPIRTCAVWCTLGNSSRRTPRLTSKAAGGTLALGCIGEYLLVYSLQEHKLSGGGISRLPLLTFPVAPAIRAAIVCMRTCAVQRASGGTHLLQEIQTPLPDLSCGLSAAGGYRLYANVRCMVHVGRDAFAAGNPDSP